MTWTKALPTTLTIVADTADIMAGNFTAFNSFVEAEHYGCTCASPGVHTPGKVTALYVDTLTNIKNLATAAGSSMAFDTVGKNLFYHDSTRYRNIGGFCPSGTKMIFYQDTAPTGWTIENTLDDKLLYLTSTAAEGGAPHATGTWTVAAHTHTDDGHVLTIAEMPSHKHSRSNAKQCYVHEDVPSHWGLDNSAGIESQDGTIQNTATRSQGGGGSHNHSTAGNCSVDYSTWRPDSFCCIIATKN